MATRIYNEQGKLISEKDITEKHLQCNHDWVLSFDHMDTTGNSREQCSKCGLVHWITNAIGGENDEQS